MKRLAAVLVLASLSGCASSDWTRADTVAELAWQGMNVVDYYQTKDIQYHDGLYEANPLSRAVLGSQPGSAATAQLMVTYALSHYLISRALPKKWRPYWHGGMVAGKWLTIKKNHELGLARKHDGE